MAFRPSDSLKKVAVDLAELIFQEDGDTRGKEYLWQQLSGSESTIQRSGNGKEKTVRRRKGSIGIWNPVIKNGKTYYRRDVEKQVEWPLWAGVHEIQPRSSRKRVLLFGESVARGYFYDPHYTVANELEAILHNINWGEETEVIDLARTSIKMNEILDLARACLPLEPDAVVIMAGNNWASELTDSLDRDDYKQIFELYAKSQFKGVKSFLEKRFKRIVTAFLKEIEQSLIKEKVPVIFVIPAYNLAGWKSDDIEKTLSWLPGNGMVEWLSARDIGQEAFDNEEMGQLELAATRMVELDASNPLGYEWMAYCHIVSGEWDKAISCLEASRDTVLIGRGKNTKPRCFKAIYDTLLGEANAIGIRIVDLPKIFSELSPHKVPDSKFFLDYCHLSVKGIKVAMKYTAGELMQVFSCQGIPIENIREGNVYPDNYVQATANFCAAIHNAHHGQPSSIVNYYCNQAVQLSPLIKDTMIKYIDFSTRYASTAFCKTFEEIISEERMRQYEGGLALPHPPRGKLMDVILVDAVVNALMQAGIFVQQQITDLRISEHGVTTAGVDLLESYYSKNCYNDFNANPAPDFLAVRSTESRFYFIAEKNSSIRITIAYRTASDTTSGKNAYVSVNENRTYIAVLPASKCWKTVSFIIPGERVDAGVNELNISWPYVSQPLEVKNDISVNSFLKAAFPILGEIYSLTAVAVSV